MNEDGQKGMVLMQTVGFYHSRDRKIVRLASDLEPESGEFRTFHVIPRIHIIRLQSLPELSQP